MTQELFIPGPVELSSAAYAAQARRVVSHRSDEFHEVFTACRDGLRKAYKTDGEVLLFTASGTGAIDAGLQNTILDSDRVLVFDNGDFGRRLSENAALYAKECTTVKIGYGKGIRPGIAQEAIENYRPTYVALVHNDTSDGVLNPLADIARTANAQGAFVFVDAVSSLGGSELAFDGWGIGACASAAQKCIGGPAGMSFLALSGDAKGRIGALEKPRSAYFDLKRYLASAAKDEHPTTPSLAGFFGLEQALAEVAAEGVDARVARHAKMADFVRKRVAELGGNFFVEEGYRSQTVTAIATDRSKELREGMTSKGFALSGGMKEYKNRILRVAHMANMTTERLAAMLDALEETVGSRGF